MVLPRTRRAAVALGAHWVWVLKKSGFRVRAVSVVGVLVARRALARCVLVAIRRLDVLSYHERHVCLAGANGAGQQAAHSLPRRNESGWQDASRAPEPGLASGSAQRKLQQRLLRNIQLPLPLP